MGTPGGPPWPFGALEQLLLRILETLDASWGALEGFGGPLGARWGALGSMLVAFGHSWGGSGVCLGSILRHVGAYRAGP